MNRPRTCVRLKVSYVFGQGTPDERVVEVRASLRGPRGQKWAAIEEMTRIDLYRDGRPADAVSLDDLLDAYAPTLGGSRLAAADAVYQDIVAQALEGDLRWARARPFPVQVVREPSPLLRRAERLTEGKGCSR